MLAFWERSCSCDQPSTSEDFFAAQDLPQWHPGDLPIQEQDAVAKREELHRVARLAGITLRGPRPVPYKAQSVDDLVDIPLASPRWERDLLSSSANTPSSHSGAYASERWQNRLGCAGSDGGGIRIEPPLIIGRGSADNRDASDACASRWVGLVPQGRSSSRAETSEQAMVGLLMKTKYRQSRPCMRRLIRDQKISFSVRRKRSQSSRRPLSSMIQPRCTNLLP